MSLKTNLLRLLRFLFGRCEQNSRWFYLIIAIPFIFSGLMGWEYGAFWPYMIPVLLCIVHFFYSTIFVWFIIFFLYFVWAVAYTYGVVNDLFALIKGFQPSIFLGSYDTIVFTILFIAVVSITFGLFKLRPSKRKRKGSGVRS